jgi:predicted nucleic acid-binding protein
VLIDVFGADPEFGERSREAVRDCLAEGGLVACDVVWAEVTGAFADAAAARGALERLGVRYSALEAPAALAAGEAWAAYRRGGGPRDRVIADFLIGAHASLAADRLLTRDRGFYRRYFEGVVLVDPSAERAQDTGGH